MALTFYEKYIRTDELLRLQKPQESLSCHDEMQFQIVHQAHDLFLEGSGVGLREVYEHPHDHHELFQLAEGLVDYDWTAQQAAKGHEPGYHG